MALVSRYSSSPYIPCSLPFPDILKPPNGAGNEPLLGLLIIVCPASIFLANLKPSS